MILSKGLGLKPEVVKTGVLSLRGIVSTNYEKFRL